MTLEQNITAILETYFSGFKDELIEACAKRIMEQVERQADTPQTDYPTEWCAHCELWKEDNCIGVAQCKQNIKALKELSDLYEADTPQTDCNANQCVQRVEYIGDIEKKRCRTCKHFESEFHTLISSDGTYYPYVICTAKECHYESVDTPQTDCERYVVVNDEGERVYNCIGCQTDCGWK